MQFDGSNFIYVPAVNVPQSNYTYEFWFCPDKNLDKNSPEMVLISAKFQSNPSIIFNKNKNGKIGFYIKIAGKMYSLESSQENWEGKKWLHLALTWNGTSLLMYVNGANDKSTNPLENSLDQTNGLFLGGESTQQKGWKGKIDEFKIWNIALSSTQIKETFWQQISKNKEEIQGKTDNRIISGNLKWANLLMYYTFADQRQTILNVASPDFDASLGLDLAVGTDDPKISSEMPFPQTNHNIQQNISVKTFQSDTYDDPVDQIPTGLQSAFVPLNQDYYHLVDRYEILYNKFANLVYTTTKPYTRKGVANFADSIRKANQTQGFSLTPTDQFNIQYLLNDNAEWADSVNNLSKFSIFKTFYKTKADFLQVKTKNFDFHINPVIYFNYGQENYSTGISNRNIGEERTYINTRGVEFRGMIGKRLSFYAFLTDNQAFFPKYARNKIDELNAVPNEGFWKKMDNGGVDYFTAKGYITFNILKNVSLQFGHDKNIYGVGHRSLFLSDFSSNYLFLKLNTQIWKFNYTNIFAQMTADVLAANDVFPKKYAVFHHLGINITRNLNIGLFESVVYARKDGRINDTFEFGYLNPIMFYRSVEQNLGSADNSLLGMDFKWNFLNRFQLYGQILLDEFVLKEFLQENKGWWANKQALQLGAKWIDIVPNMDLQVETNIIRPYTYTHFNNEELSNYANYKQAIAHPLGANFYEYIGILRYQPVPQLALTAKLIYARSGQDKTGKNWGSNILLDNTTRVQDYGNSTAQGIKTSLLFADFTASYQFRHNLFIDAKFLYRNLDSEIDEQKSKTTMISLSLRLNIAQRLQEF